MKHPGTCPRLGRAHADAPPSLDDLKYGRPGERFQRLYEKRKGSCHGSAKNVTLIVTGIAIIAVGIVTYPVPLVPSEVMIACGLALIAQCSGRGARLLDRLELRFRKRCAPAIKLWKRLPGVAKVLIAVTSSSAVGVVSVLLVRAVTN